MADFFEEKPMDEQPQTFRVGEKDYTQEELNQLVGLGEQSRDLESKWNTKLDSLMPAYTKTTQELAEMRKRENEWLKEKEELSKPKVEPTKEQQTEEEAARLLKDKFKVVTEDEFETKFRQRYTTERLAEKLNDKLSKLSEEIDGSDGRVKFDPQDILNYMGQTNIPDPEIAYKVKYDRQLSEWQQKQLASVKKPGLVTTDSGTGTTKEPPKVKITRANLQAMVREALGE